MSKPSRTRAEEVEIRFMAALVWPFVVALRYSTPLFFVLLVASQIVLVAAGSGRWGHFAGEGLLVLAVVVSSLGLGASLERAGATRRRGE